MPDVRRDVSSEDASSKSVARAGWGLLLIWIGAALLLNFGWGAGLIGAGTIVLGAQGVRRYLGLNLDRFGVVVGFLLVVCGVWNMFDVTVQLVPLLCIGAGIALLVSIWTARRAPRGPGGGADVHAASHPQA
jgi:hypothetical protein